MINKIKIICISTKYSVSNVTIYSNYSMKLCNKTLKYEKSKVNWSNYNNLFPILYSWTAFLQLSLRMSVDAKPTKKNWMYFLFRSRLAECSCDRRKIKTEIQNKINQEDERSSDTKFAKIPTAHAQTPAKTQEKNQDCDKSSTSGSGNQDPANKQGQKWTSLDLKQGFYRGVYLGLWFYYFYYEFI